MYTVYRVSGVVGYNVGMKLPPPLQWCKDQLLWAVSFVGQQLGYGLVALQGWRYRRLVYALVATNGLSVLLFGLRLIGAENFRYWFMLWNLFLAWIAPLIAWWLARRLRHSSWATWQNVLLTVLWLGFLPNSFYMVSDLIHIQQTGEISIYFDTVLFTSFIFNGFIAGFVGMFLVHRHLAKRLSIRRTWLCIVGIFMLSSYAIYLGRVLRWNTWDALVQPAALLFDVSDNILNPLAHPQAFVVTVSFTLLITGFYVVAWEYIKAIRT